MPTWLSVPPTLDSKHAFSLVPADRPPQSAIGELTAATKDAGCVKPPDIKVSIIPS